MPNMVIRVVKFSRGGKKLERCLSKNQHTKRKLLNFENWCNGKLLKSALIWISKSIFYVKNQRNPSQFFLMKNIQLGAHFLIHNINFLITSFSKMMLNFWYLPIAPILKIQWFPLSMLFFRQKSFQFCTPHLKTWQPVLP